MAQEAQDKAKETSSSSSTESRPYRSSGGSRPQRGGFRGRRGRFQPRRKVCLFCTDKEKTIDWKDTDGLRRFISDSGSLFPRRKTGLCARHQRRVAIAVKRARHIAVLPYTSEHVRIMGGGRG
ncbi:MAG: 30S ribosomal protein S18 [Chloroflexi bacterium]|nr:MAG: 30S ribosomal protein S18 [Chloroflexota bacterium]